MGARTSGRRRPRGDAAAVCRRDGCRSPSRSSRPGTSARRNSSSAEPVTSVVSLADDALAVLRRNDTGRFVKPSQRLYPWQWNWDSAFVVDRPRGRSIPSGRETEVRSLLRAASGPTGWSRTSSSTRSRSTTGRARSSGARMAATVLPTVATSGLIAAAGARDRRAGSLHEAAPDTAFLDEVVPKLDAWHEWFHRERTRRRSGLMAIFHGWESADNAPRFDRALARIDVEGVEPIERTDTGPGRRGRAADRPRLPPLPRARHMAARSRLPAQTAVVGAVRVSRSAAQLDPRRRRGRSRRPPGARWASTARRARAAAAQLRDALAAMWDDGRAARTGSGTCTATEGVTDTVADLFPLYAGVPDERQARRLVDEHLLAPERFGPSPEAPWAVTTVAKSSPAFDPRGTTGAGPCGSTSTGS